MVVLACTVIEFFARPSFPRLPTSRTAGPPYFHLLFRGYTVGSKWLNMDTLNSMAKGTAKVPHPFYPLEANIVGYLANDWTYVELLTSFAAGWVVILGTTQLVVRRFNPNLSLWERAIICWFILCMSCYIRQGTSC